jgi:hypothetical protein
LQSNQLIPIKSNQDFFSNKILKNNRFVLEGKHVVYQTTSASGGSRNFMSGGDFFFALQVV